VSPLTRTRRRTRSRNTLFAIALDSSLAPIFKAALPSLGALVLGWLACLVRWRPPVNNFTSLPPDAVVTHFAWCFPKGVFARRTLYILSTCSQPARDPRSYPTSADRQITGQSAPCLTNTGRRNSRPFWLPRVEGLPLYCPPQCPR